MNNKRSNLSRRDELNVEYTATEEQARCWPDVHVKSLNPRRRNIQDIGAVVSGAYRERLFTLQTQALLVVPLNISADGRRVVEVKLFVCFLRCCSWRSSDPGFSSQAWSDGFKLFFFFPLPLQVDSRINSNMDPYTFTRTLNEAWEKSRGISSWSFAWRPRLHGDLKRHRQGNSEKWRPAPTSRSRSCYQLNSEFCPRVMK